MIYLIFYVNGLYGSGTDIHEVIQTFSPHLFVGVNVSITVESNHSPKELRHSLWRSMSREQQVIVLQLSAEQRE